jgi:hypothetical protein
MELSTEERRTFVKLVEEEIIACAALERDAILNYLRKHGLDSPSAAVVDIGWQGTIQTAVKQITGNNNLNGFYFSLHDTSKTRNDTTMHAFIDPRKGSAEKSWHDDGLMKGLELIEFLFGSPEEASILTVQSVGGEFKKLFTEERMSPSQSAVLKELQASALEFIDDVKSASQFWPKSAAILPRDSALTYLGELILNPSLAQAMSLGSIHHDNSLGVDSQALAMPKYSAKFYKSSPERIRLDRESVWWKPGFDVIVKSYMS